MSTVAEHIDREAWLEERKTGVGGSEVAALFPADTPTGTLHPYLTLRELWEKKTGKGKEEPENRWMRRGRRLEPVAADFFTEVTGRRVRRAPLRRHPEAPHVLCSIDRQVLAGPDYKGKAHQTAPLEIKVLGSHSFRRTTREGLKDHYILQGIHEALVWAYAETAFALYQPDNDDLAVFDVDYQPDAGERILEAVEGFWTRNVERDIPPEVAITTPLDKLPRVDGTMMQVDDPGFARAVADYLEARDVIHDAEELKEVARDGLIQAAQALGGYGHYQGAGAHVYWREEGGRTAWKGTFEALMKLGPIPAYAVEQVLREHGALNPPLLSDILDHRIQEAQVVQMGKPFPKLDVYKLRERED